MIVDIFDYGMNGEGVAKQDGKVLLVDHALVREQVDCEIILDHNNYATAKVKNILKQSKNRTTPHCPYFYQCGGCDLQHMEYAEQLRFKSSLIKKTINKIVGVDVAVSDTIPSQNCYNYRNKSSFAFKNGKSGFYQQNSNDIVEISKCIISSENINLVYKLFTEFASNFKDKERIKNLVVRDINNQILVGVVTIKELNLLPFWNILKQQFSQIGLCQIINTRNDSVVLSGKVIHVAGLDKIKILNFGLDYQVDLLGFHQTNEDIQNKIYEKVLNFISPNSVVVNGFSGQGLLSAIVAKKAKHVYGIEINHSSHTSAERLKFDNNIANMTNILGDFYKKFDKIKEKIDTIILDPSKKGCGKDVIHAIIGVKNIIYISCNPIALAKDLRELLASYEIENIIPFDMFPNTKSVETLLKLKLKEK
ncbi:MAG: 23S rRNA (uracil(1939)-C(5))-methyltransferase RlmD [Clostridia bacterium]|nr:23S rRNA (uracil(1939)-C(5))-methyltransferase RlmD [Clostridia bacterium]